MDITILLHLRSSSWANPSHNATIFHGSSSRWNLLLSASHTSWTCWRDSQWISQERTSWSAPGNVNGGACPNHRATLNRSEQNLNTTWLQGFWLVASRGEILDSFQGRRGAWSLHLLLQSPLHLRPGLSAEHSWGNPELQHLLWKAMDLHAQGDWIWWVILSTAYRWGTDYAPTILVTAICDCNGSKRRQIVTDSHCCAADVYFWGCKDWKEPILNGPNFS